MEKPSQWVSKLCRLYFADEYARRTVGLPSATHVPDIETALQAVQKILPKLEARMIEFLAEWLVTFLIRATHVLEVRAPQSLRPPGSKTSWCPANGPRAAPTATWP